MGVVVEDDRLVGADEVGCVVVVEVGPVAVGAPTGGSTGSASAQAEVAAATARIVTNVRRITLIVQIVM